MLSFAKFVHQRHKPRQFPVYHGYVSESISRRNFYVGAIYGLGAAIAAALGIPAAIYLLLPPKLRKAEEWAEVGDITRLESNSPTEMTFRRTRVDGWKVTSEKATAWVVKHPDNSVTAFGPPVHSPWVARTTGMKARLNSSAPVTIPSSRSTAK